MYIHDLNLHGFPERIPNQVVFNFFKCSFLAFWFVVDGIYVNTPMEFTVFYSCGAIVCAIAWIIHFVFYTRPVMGREGGRTDEIEPLTGSAFTKI